jgi:hypothetical protein
VALRWRLRRDTRCIVIEIVAAEDVHATQGGVELDGHNSHDAFAAIRIDRPDE